MLTDKKKGCPNKFNCIDFTIKDGRVCNVFNSVEDCIEYWKSSKATLGCEGCKFSSGKNQPGHCNYGFSLAWDENGKCLRRRES